MIILHFVFFLGKFFFGGWGGLEISHYKINLRTEITHFGGRKNRAQLFSGSSGSSSGRYLLPWVKVDLYLRRRKGANDSGGEFKALELWHPSSDLCLHIVCFFKFYGKKIASDCAEKSDGDSTRHLKKSGCRKIVLKTMRGKKIPARAMQRRQKKVIKKPLGFDSQ